MKFSIVRSKLLDGLQTVQNVVTSKSTLQILQNALLAAADGKLSITTTDVDISERCEVECEVEEAGQTTLPVKRFVSVIRELNEDKVQIELDDANVASVQCGSSFFKFIGLPARDFPPIPVPDEGFCYRVDQGVFREMLRKTCYATSQDETRRVLNGVLMSFKEKKLTMVATDGRRMAKVDHEVEFPENEERDMVLPAKAVSELLRILSSEGELRIYFKQGQVMFAFDGKLLTSKLIEGVYPDYRKVIPDSSDERVVIDRNALLASVRRVSTVTTDKFNSVKLTFSANQLTITTSAAEVGEARDTMPIKYAGKEISIIFNPEFVMDPLKTIDDDEIVFELSNGYSPALLKCSIPFLYVLMPLRI
ncbi:MAG: DNA polymerase III subunit beta [Kiritimatiellae bacterium]|nr:DNA polymerase III subunit beta [Kiritimatiellia bacterium]